MSKTRRSQRPFVDNPANMKSLRRLPHSCIPFPEGWNELQFKVTEALEVSDRGVRPLTLENLGYAAVSSAQSLRR
jgi:hypothetical protein